MEVDNAIEGIGNDHHGIVKRQGALQTRCKRFIQSPSVDTPGSSRKEAVERLRGLLRRKDNGRDGQLAGPVSDGAEVAEDMVGRLVGIACQHEEVVAPSRGAEE